MKATGIVRRIDELGRVVLPKELRDTLGIKSGDALEIYTGTDQIVLKKYAPGCSLCGEVDNRLLTFKDKQICTQCIKDLTGGA